MTAHDHPRRSHHERGANLFEYVILVTVIAVASILAVVVFRNETNDSFSRSAVEVESANP